MAARWTYRQVSLQVKRLDGVVVHQQPVWPDTRFQSFEDGRDSAVAVAARGRQPQFQPLAQVDQSIPYAIMMLSPYPPDDLVVVSVEMDEFGSYFGFTNSAHARDNLRSGMSPPADEVGAQRCQLHHPAGEIRIAGRDLGRPDPLGRPRRGSFRRSPARRRRDIGWAHPQRLRSVFCLPGGLPESQEHGSVPMQRLDYFFQEAPARQPRAAEHVVDARRTDPAATGSGGDLSHGRTAGRQVQLIEAIKKLGNRPGRGRLAPDCCHRLILSIVQGCPRLSKLVH